MLAWVGCSHLTRSASIAAKAEVRSANQRSELPLKLPHLLFILFLKKTSGTMEEPFATFLMPTYAIVSWIGLFLFSKTGKHLLPIAAFGWAWAVINCIHSKRLDLGAITFGLVIVSSLWERHSGFDKKVRVALTISCICVAMNFSLPLILWSQMADELAKEKSDLWLSIFFWYCVSMTVFWICAAIRNQIRGENTYGLVPGIRHIN